MILTGESKYKTLYNNFLTSSKNYSEFINTSFIDLYNQQGHGVLEETFRYVSYEWGNIMNRSINLVGFPQDSLKRLDEKHIELINSITAQTTGIQQELPFGSSDLDREYVKKVLLRHSKSSWKELRELLVDFLIELRDRQLNLSNNIDKLNLVFANVGGYLTGSSNNGLVSFSLTTGTSTTNILSNVSATTNTIEGLFSNIVGSITPEYDTKLTHPNEYLFFVDKLMSNEIIRYMDSHHRYSYAENLIFYRNDELIKDLTKIKRKYTDGVKKEISEEFRKNLLKFSITLLNYDTKKYKKYFDKTEIPNELEKVKSIPKTTDNFEVNFTQSNSELSLVRRFFDSTVMGTNNSSYNLKITKNISIT
tara:strand:- start:1260 stop:2351 length:1092 start_codon:yes stop_codon:yes gene_type:complete